MYNFGVRIGPLSALDPRDIAVYGKDQISLSDCGARTVSKERWMLGWHDVSHRKWLDHCDPVLFSESEERGGHNAIGRASLDKNQGLVGGGNPAGKLG